MRVLLTGSAGHGGRGIARVLAASHHLRGMDVRASDDAMESVVGDVTDIEDCRDAVSGMDAVVVSHMGPRKPDSYAPPFLGFDINVRGTANLYQACVEHGIKQVVLVTSFKVLGPESDPCAPPGEICYGPGGDIYAVTKIMQENLAYHFFVKHQIVTTVLRPAWLVYESECCSKSGRPADRFDPYLLDPVDLGDVVALCLDRAPDVLEAYVPAQPECRGMDATMARLDWHPRHTFAHLRERA